MRWVFHLHSQPSVLQPPFSGLCKQRTPSVAPSMASQGSAPTEGCRDVGWTVRIWMQRCNVAAVALHLDAVAW